MSNQISPFLFNASQMVGMGNVDANLKAQEILGAVEDERRNAKTGEIEKKRVSRPTFTIKHLQGPKGLNNFHKEINKVKFKKGKHTAMQNIKILMRKYKEWGNDMYPMNFRNFMQKLEKMSGKRQIQDELQNLRNKRDGFVDEPFEINDDDFGGFGGPPAIHQINLQGGENENIDQLPDLEDMMMANEISANNNNNNNYNKSSQMSSSSSSQNKFSVPKKSFGLQKKKTFGSSFKKKTFGSFKKKSFGFNSGKKLKFATKANVKKILTQVKNNSSSQKKISLMEMLSQKKQSLPPQQQQQSPQQANIPISNENKNKNNKKEEEEIDPLASCANELESLFGPSQQVEKKKMESKFQESMDVDQPSEKSLDHLFKSKEEPSSKPFARPSPKQNKPSEASPKDNEDKKMATTPPSSKPFKRPESSTTEKRKPSFFLARKKDPTSSPFQRPT